jgi:hypothetical protein
MHLSAAFFLTSFRVMTFDCSFNRETILLVVQPALRNTDSECASKGLESYQPSHKQSIMDNNNNINIERLIKWTLNFDNIY